MPKLTTPKEKQERMVNYQGIWTLLAEKKMNKKTGPAGWLI
ncbi:MAG: hypothetical protein E7K67_12730 [Peptostreptococcaceae bacterium]|nr:hypothetical protein [Peptostreptococcaceae bacterium]